MVKHILRYYAPNLDSNFFDTTPCMHACMHAGTHTRARARTHARTPTRARPRARTHTHARARTHARAHTRAHTHTHIFVSFVLNLDGGYYGIFILGNVWVAYDWLIKNFTKLRRAQISSQSWQVQNGNRNSSVKLKITINKCRTAKMFEAISQKWQEETQRKKSSNLIQ